MTILQMHSNRRHRISIGQTTIIHFVNRPIRSTAEKKPLHTILADNAGAVPDCPRDLSMFIMTDQMHAPAAPHIRTIRACVVCTHARICYTMLCARRGAIKVRTLVPVPIYVYSSKCSSNSHFARALEMLQQRRSTFGWMWQQNIDDDRMQTK